MYHVPFKHVSTYCKRRTNDVDVAFSFDGVVSAVVAVLSFDHHLGRGQKGLNRSMRSKDCEEGREKEVIQARIKQFVYNDTFTFWHYFKDPQWI